MLSAVPPEPAARFTLLDAINNDVNQHKHKRTSRLLSDQHTQRDITHIRRILYHTFLQPSALTSFPLRLLSSASLLRLTGLLESSPSASSQLQRFLTRFHTVNSPASDATTESGDVDASAPPITAASITGVCFILNAQAFEAMLEAPSPLLLSLMCSLRRSGGNSTNAEATDASTGVASLKVLSFVEETPRAFPLFTTRSLRLQPADDWPNPAPGTAVTGGSGTEAGAGLASTLSAPPHTPSPLLPFTFSTLHSLLLLASHLAALPSRSAQREFLLSPAPSRQLLERVVSVERCVGYSQCAELMSAEDFCSLFASSPLTQQAEDRPDKEQVWPVEKYSRF